MKGLFYCGSTNLPQGKLSNEGERNDFKVISHQELTLISIIFPLHVLSQCVCVCVLVCLGNVLMMPDYCECVCVCVFVCASEREKNKFPVSLARKFAAKSFSVKNDTFKLNNFLYSSKIYVIKVSLTPTTTTTQIHTQEYTLFMEINCFNSNPTLHGEN